MAVAVLCDSPFLLLSRLLFTAPFLWIFIRQPPRESDNTTTQPRKHPRAGCCTRRRTRSRARATSPTSAPCCRPCNSRNSHRCSLTRAAAFSRRRRAARLQVPIARSRSVCAAASRTANGRARDCRAKARPWLVPACPLLHLSHPPLQGHFWPLEDPEGFAVHVQGLVAGTSPPQRP